MEYLPDGSPPVPRISVTTAAKRKKDALLHEVSFRPQKSTPCKPPSSDRRRETTIIVSRRRIRRKTICRQITFFEGH